MADATITKKPTATPQYLSSPARQSGGRTWKSTWKVSSSATDRSRNDRIEGYIERWTLDYVSIKDKSKTRSRHYTHKNSDPSNTSCWINLNSWVPDEAGSTWTRNDAYPGASTASKEYANGWCLRKIRLDLRFTNRKGEGPAVVREAKILQPASTTISVLKQDETSGHVSCTVKNTDSAKTNSEVHSSWAVLNVYDSRVAKSKSNPYVKTYLVGSASSRTISYDVADRMQLSYSQYVRVRVQAWTRGFWGNSKVTTQTLYVSWPQKPVIKSLQIPSTDTTGKVTAIIKIDQSKEAHPTTGVKLQALVDCEYATASEIPGSETWTDIIEDDGQCTALSTTVATLQPSAGNYTWVRVKAWNQLEDYFMRYSDPVEAKKLYRPAPSAENDKVGIVSTTAGSDGESIKVVVGYTEDTTNTGTEIAWSSYKDAWESTDEPDSYQFTWYDSTSQSQSWDSTATITIRGLEEGTRYYIRARRYLESDDGTTYSKWSAKNSYWTLATTNPDGTVESVTLSAPSFIPSGAALPVSWTYSSEETQTRWQIVDSAGKVLASGSDATGATTIPASVVAAKASDDAITTKARVYVGGAWLESDSFTTTIAEVPVAYAEDGTITAKPATVTIGASSACDATLVMRSMGASGTFDGGLRDQVAGDVVWSTAISPEWEDPSNSSTNLCSNDPDNWEGPDDDGYSYSPVIAVTEGDTYIASVTTSSDANGTYTCTVFECDEDGEEDGDSYSAGTSFEPATSYVRILVSKSGVDTTDMDEDEAEDAEKVYPGEIGTYAFVQLEEGSTATGWTACADDLPELVAEVDVSDETDLRDGGTYELSVTLTDPTTGLVSEEVVGTYTVAWARQAPDPGDVTVTPYDVTSDDVRTIYATIETEETDDEDDRVEVYRLTPDGAYLIASDVIPGDTVTDPYAPFGSEDMAYRVAVRTSDGDVAWADYSYELPGKGLRVDWDGGYAELPYNVNKTDSYSKDFEARAHMDGTVDGYWNEAVQRTRSLSTDVMRLFDMETVRRVRELARHPGACFVRTSDGCAFTASVSVNSINDPFNSLAISVALDATEIATAPLFMGQTEAAEDEEEEEEEEG